MKTRNNGNDVLKMIRKIRQENYETTKNMTPEEVRDYYHKGAMEFRAEFEEYIRREKNRENKE